MSARHRKQAPGWKLPAGIGAAIAAGLVVTVSLVDAGPQQPVESLNAAFSLPRKVTSSTSTTTSTTTTAAPAPVTPTTTASAPPPAPVTTTTPKPKPAPPKNACSTTLDGAQPHVAQVGNHIAAKFGVKDIGGAAGRAGASDHPEGLALDFMVDTATGNAIADYVLANQRAFGVTYVIWRQRYNDGGGWSAMEDRGGATANHYDHVHVSFRAGVKVSVTC